MPTPATARRIPRPFTEEPVNSGQSTADVSNQLTTRITKTWTTGLPDSYVFLSLKDLTPTVVKDFGRIAVGAPTDAYGLLASEVFVKKLHELFGAVEEPTTRVVDESDLETGVFIVARTRLDASKALDAVLALKTWLRAEPTLKNAAHVPVTFDQI